MTKQKSRSYVYIIKNPENPKVFFAGFRINTKDLSVSPIWVFEKKNARWYEDLSVMGPALQSTKGIPSRYYNYE